MRGGRLLLALFLLASLARAQVTIMGPGGSTQNPSRPSDRDYGPPRVVELEALLLADGYNRAHVITEGEVSAFEPGRYWTLGLPTARLLIIPGRDFDPGELDKVVGRRTEVRGIVRLLREKQYLPNGMDLDSLEDPLLPPMPPPQFERGWPRISITVFSIRDRTSPETTRPRGEVGGGISSQILNDPASYLGKKTRIYGQFRGRNLFGDLPAGSARSKDDWVLKDGDTALWVMGKAPKGEGWKLGLDYKGDSKSWLDVEGKPEVLNGVLYLRATKVLISKAPDKQRPEPR